MGAPGSAKRLELGQVFEAPDGTRREVVGWDGDGRVIVRTIAAIEPNNLRLWARRNKAVCKCV